ncbi:hypothetical protein FKM82_017927 [Ascaphus truei]
MGALMSRQHAGVEEVDIPSNSVYRYPPKSGSYFAGPYHWGGAKFDCSHPEGFLFGENSDLNFLGSRPVTVCPHWLQLGHGMSSLVTARSRYVLIGYSSEPSAVG